MPAVLNFRSIFLILLFTVIYGTDLHGQGGAVEHHAAGQPLVELTYGMRYSPICVGENFYSLQGEEDKKHPLKKRFVLNAYERGNPAAVATRELQFQAEEERFDVREFFVANGGPAVLYRLWNEKTGLVRLFVIGYDPNTLEPLGAPVQIGEIPFDPKNYYGTGPLVQVASSTSGDKMLFYFDKIKMSDIQLIMCWVTDAEFVPEWSAIYKVPVHSTGSNIEMHFSDEGAVYLNVSAVLLTDENLKEKADGSTKVVGVKNSDFRNKQATFFKLHDDEFIQWKCDLGADIVHDIAMDVIGNKVWFGALSSASEKGDPTDWLIGSMSTDFSPSVEFKMPIQDEKKTPEYMETLVMDEQGGGHLLGGKLDRLFVCSFDAAGKELYQTNMKWSPYLSVNPFSKDGRLFLGVIASSQDPAKPEELQLKTMNPALFPVLISFGENGKLKVDQLISKEEGGQRVYGSIEPDFEAIERCGYFIDFSYDKKRPGLISVPIGL